MIHEKTNSEHEFTKNYGPGKNVFCSAKVDHVNKSIQILPHGASVIDKSNIEEVLAAKQLEVEALLVLRTEAGI